MESRCALKLIWELGNTDAILSESVKDKARVGKHLNDIARTCRGSIAKCETVMRFFAIL